ncbi:MAG TPA: hypothetical protein VKD26_03130 [Streptosporangiaceae bacterium]|nr:hypothetical protein [Streptosporangiaceae bacterium]
MRIAALVLWIATAWAGLYLLVIWLSRVGVRPWADKAARFSFILICAHPALAATGLGLWVAYLATAQVRLAWAAFGVLCGAALLGFTMLARHLAVRGGRHAPQAARHFPGYVVAAHVSVGVATFTVVLITATIVSRGG